MSITIYYFLSLTAVTAPSANESCTEGPLQLQVDLSEQMNQDYSFSDTSHHQTMVPYNGMRLKLPGFHPVEGEASLPKHPASPPNGKREMERRKGERGGGEGSAF